MVGNPVSKAFLTLPAAADRYVARQGALQLLVVGGSLGAVILNQVVPEALSRRAPAERHVVRHQAGQQHIAALQQKYRELGVEASCEACIEDMAAAYFFFKQKTAYEIST